MAGRYSGPLRFRFEGKEAKKYIGLARKQMGIMLDFMKSLHLTQRVWRRKYLNNVFIETHAILPNIYIAKIVAENPPLKILGRHGFRTFFTTDDFLLEYTPLSADWSVYRNSEDYGSRYPKPFLDGNIFWVGASEVLSLKPIGANPGVYSRGEFLLEKPISNRTPYYVMRHVSSGQIVVVSSNELGDLGLYSHSNGNWVLRGSRGGVPQLSSYRFALDEDGSAITAFKRSTSNVSVLNISFNGSFASLNLVSHADDPMFGEERIEWPDGYSSSNVTSTCSDGVYYCANIGGPGVNDQLSGSLSWISGPNGCLGPDLDNLPTCTLNALYPDPTSVEWNYAESGTSSSGLNVNNIVRYMGALRMNGADVLITETASLNRSNSGSYTKNVEYYRWLLYPGSTTATTETETNSSYSFDLKFVADVAGIEIPLFCNHVSGSYTSTSYRLEITGRPTESSYSVNASESYTRKYGFYEIDYANRVLYYGVKVIKGSSSGSRTIDSEEKIIDLDSRATLFQYTDPNPTFQYNRGSTVRLDEYPYLDSLHTFVACRTVSGNVAVIVREKSTGMVVFHRISNGNLDILTDPHTANGILSITPY